MQVARKIVPYDRALSAQHGTRRNRDDVSAVSSGAMKMSMTRLNISTCPEPFKEYVLHILQSISSYAYIDIGVYRCKRLY